MELIKSQQERGREVELIANCDAIIFGSYQQEANVHTIMTFMKTKNKVEPTECGHKFSILLFDRLSPTEKDIEIFTAILGDPKGYVERMGKSGYHGLVVKQNACKHKKVKEVFHRVLFNYGFEEKLIRKVLRQTVV